MSEVDEQRLAETEVTETRLRSIEARLAAATPGPWKMCVDDCGAKGVESEWGIIAENLSETDANLLANAPTDLADLCAALREAWAENEMLRSAEAENWRAKERAWADVERLREEFMRELDYEQDRKLAEMDGGYSDD